MQDRFVYTAHPSRVVFGAGSLAALADEVKALGCRSAFVLTTPQQEATGAEVVAQLGPLAAGLFPGAAMHTPIAVTERALAAFEAAKADCTVAIGGGSTTGLGKALALRTNLPQIVVPTTYAGSEMTNILGETADGKKTTQRSARILPETVIYDVDLTLGLPVRDLRHLWRQRDRPRGRGALREDRNPITSLIAEEGVRALTRALPAYRDDAARSHGAARRALWRLALRRLSRRRRHGSASQALPRARRRLRSAACGDAHRHSAARARLQRAGGAGGGGQDRRGDGRRGRAPKASTTSSAGWAGRAPCAKSACPRTASSAPPRSPSNCPTGIRARSSASRSARCSSAPIAARGRRHERDASNPAARRLRRHHASRARRAVARRGADRGRPHRRGCARHRGGRRRDDRRARLHRHSRPHQRPYAHVADGAARRGRQLDAARIFPLGARRAGDAVPPRRHPHCDAGRRAQSDQLRFDDAGRLASQQPDARAHRRGGGGAARIPAFARRSSMARPSPTRVRANRISPKFRIRGARSSGCSPARSRHARAR